MKRIKIIGNGRVIGNVVPSGAIAYNSFRQAVGISWTSYNIERKPLEINQFINYHNGMSHIQIEELQTEAITLD